MAVTLVINSLTITIGAKCTQATLGFHTSDNYACHILLLYYNQYQMLYTKVHKKALPAVASVQEGQFARGLKQDHDCTRAVVGIHKSDSHACHLEWAVQGYNVEELCWHLQALLNQACCDGRAVDYACSKRQLHVWAT